LHSPVREKHINCRQILFGLLTAWTLGHNSRILSSWGSSSADIVADNKAHHLIRGVIISIVTTSAAENSECKTR